MTIRRQSPEATKRPEGEKAALVQTAFERRVLRGLRAEWENALWLLPDDLRRTIRRPLFSIRQMPSRLGSWSLANREICLSRELVSKHGWDDVRDVLLHEMAHQVAHEGLGTTGETDHGNGFKRACLLLRADPRASGAYPTLRQRLQQGESLNEKDRMVVKIEKLMALAESGNPNEAHAAMRKAFELIARHNIDLIRQGRSQRYASIFLGRPRLRHYREAYHLAHLLQDFYFVQGVWTHAWVLEKERMGRVLEISGSFQNVQIAEYVHDTVYHYIDSAWDAYRRDKPLNRYRKTDFAVGVIEGFRSTLQNASMKNLEAGPDLDLPMCVDDPALIGYLNRRYPHLRSFSRSGPGHDRQVLADGTACGKKLVVAKGIRHREGFKNLALDYHGKDTP